MADVFISYKREDKARVAAIAAGLEAEGFSVWWDPEIPLGESYAAAIRRELDAATTVLAVWSTVSVHSEWVQEEATLGKRKGVLVPARIDPVDPPVGFTMTQTADLSGWAGDRTHSEWRKLVAQVAENAKRPAKPIPAGYRAPAAPKRGAAVWIIAGVAALALIGAAGFFAMQPGGPLSQSAGAEDGAPSETAGPNAQALADIPRLGQAMTFRSPSNAFSTAALSPDGRVVATGDALGAIRLYDATNALLLRSIEGAHSGQIMHLAWAGNDNLASAGVDRRIRLMDTNNPSAEAEVLEAPARVTALIGDPRRTEFVFADVDGRFQNVREGADNDYRLPNGHYAVSISASASGRDVAVGGSAGFAYFLHDGAEAPQALHMPGADPVYAALLSDGRRVAAATGDALRVAAPDDWSGAPLLRVPGGGASRAIAVSADGRRVAQAAGAHVFVWDLPSRRIIGRVETGESGTYLAFTPDGRRLLAATAEGEAGMYDLPAP